MNSPSFASLFSGFGLADIGAKQAGCDLAWGIELDPAIAEVSQQLGHKVFCQSVLDVDFNRLEKPDILWASPPCPNFSIAKTGAAETAADIELARAVIRAIETLEPQYFILENVEGYKQSTSLEMIENALFAAGYWVDRQVLNAADFGVPQTRRRLILRAIRGGFVPSLPQKQEWVGWYQAIEDLIPDLPETKLAQWQLDRLPGNFVDSFMVSGTPNKYGETVSIRFKAQAALTATAGTCDRRALRAVLLDVGNTIRSCTAREACEPSFTITAEKMRRPASTPKAVLSPSTRVAQMTSRCLARFQTLPDYFELPEKNKLACKGIGNGVPCKLAEVVVRSLI